MTQSLQYWRRYISSNGYRRFLHLTFFKLISELVTKHKFKKCRRLTLMSGHQLSGTKFIEIDKLSAGKNFRLEALVIDVNALIKPIIIIGNNVSFGHYCHIAAVEKITIGNNVLTGSNIYITDHDHGDYTVGSSIASTPSSPPASRCIKSAPISIGNNVFIGEHVSILKGVSIGNGVIIGTGSVVSKSLPDNCLAVGVPAKPIKYFDNNNNVWKLYNAE